MKNKRAEMNTLQLSKPYMPYNNRVNHERHNGSRAFIPSLRASKLSYLGERSEPRENARASGEASPLACLSRVCFSRYPSNGELARRLVHTNRKVPYLFE